MFLLYLTRHITSLPLAKLSRHFLPTSINNKVTVFVDIFTYASTDKLLLRTGIRKTLPLI